MVITIAKAKTNPTIKIIILSMVYVFLMCVGLYVCNQNITRFIEDINSALISTNSLVFIDI